MSKELERLIIHGFVSDTEYNRKNYINVIAEQRKLSASEADLAVEYAACIIKGRFSQAEPVILQEAHWAMVYCVDVLNQRWPAAEKIILDSGAVGVTWDYFRDLVKTQWPEAEPVLFRKPEVKAKYYEYLDWIKNPQVGLFVEPAL